jgi:hypothetical protein
VSYVPQLPAEAEAFFTSLEVPQDPLSVNSTATLAAHFHLINAQLLQLRQVRNVNRIEEEQDDPRLLD